MDIVRHCDPAGTAMFYRWRSTKPDKQSGTRAIGLGGRVVRLHEVVLLAKEHKLMSRMCHATADVVSAA